MRPVGDPASAMPAPPADHPRTLLDHAPLLLSLPSSRSRGDPYREMLGQLGQHLEDVGSILVAHSLGRDASMESVIVAAPTCCGSGCAPPRKDGMAKAAQSPVDMRDAAGRTIEPKVLEVMQRQIQSRLLFIKEQERNEKLWELAQGTKNLPPPLSPWLRDPAIGGQGHNEKDKANHTPEHADAAANNTIKAVDGQGARPVPSSSDAMMSPKSTSSRARLTFEDSQDSQHDDSVHTSERDQSARACKTEPPGSLKPLSLSTSGKSRDGEISAVASQRHQKSMALLKSVARQASFTPGKAHNHKKLLIGNGREERQAQKDKEKKKKSEEEASGDGKKKDDSSDAPFPAQDILVANVILLNALVMGISADIEWEVGWDIFEYLFTAFFLGEMLFKMRNLGLKNYFCGPDWTWNIFDFVVVTIAIADLVASVLIKVMNAGDSVDLSKFTAVKLARLGRLCRLIRLLRFKMFKELKAMIQGVFAGLRVLAWAIILFFAFIFLLAMVMRNVYSEPDFDYLTEAFGTTPWAMFTLFRCFTDGCSAHDGTPLIVHFYERYGAYFMILYMLVFLFVTIGLFNLIMAIFVDNVMESTKTMKKIQRESNHHLMEGRLREVLFLAVKRNWKLLSKRRTLGLTLGASLSDVDEDEESPEQQATVLGRCVPDKYPTLHFIAVKLERCLRRCCCRKKKKYDLTDEDEEMPSDIPKDEGNNLIIDRELFNLIIEDAGMEEMLEQLDVSTSNRWELFDVLDADMSGELGLEELIVGFMNLRGPTEKSDIVAALLCSRNTMQLVQDLQEDHENFAQQAMKELFEILSAIQIMARAQLTDEDLEDLDEHQRASVRLGGSVDHPANRTSIEMGQVASMFG